MQHKSCIVNELHCQYTVSGNKGSFDIVWLHGWGDQAATFSAVLANMPSASRHFALQLPGFGGSQAPKSPWGVTEYAHFVAAWMEKLGLKNVVLIGHSNGGAMAVMLASQRPDLIAKLVLIAASGIRSTAEQRLHRQAFKLLAKTGRVVTKPLNATMREKLKRLLYKKAGSDYLLVPHMQESFKKVVAEDVRGSASAVRQPVLLIWGEADEATPLFMGEAYASVLPESRLITIPGASHFVHQEQPERVARDIQEFVAHA